MAQKAEEEARLKAVEAARLQEEVSEICIATVKIAATFISLFLFCIGAPFANGLSCFYLCLDVTLPVCSANRITAAGGGGRQCDCNGVVRPVGCCYHHGPVRL